jgi:alkaline phosphatase D
MFSLAQISDTHLGAGTALFRANYDVVAAVLAADVPDLIVATGDVSLDGADSEADMAFAAGRFAALPRPVLAVPGNHDVGDHPDRAPRQPFDDERLNRFRRHFGADRWVVDRDGWRLLGLDSQVCGTGHQEEAAQAGFIAEALAGLGDRRLAVFLHKPVFVTTPEDPLFDYWSVPPFARAPFLPLLAHPALRLVASGHLHLHRETMAGVARFAWAPSVGFIVAEDEQPDLPGDRPCGFLRHTFHADHVETALVAPPGLTRPFIHEVRAEAYPNSVLLRAEPDAA